MPTFPSSLQQKLLVDGFENSYRDAVVRSTVDAGPEKTRLRYSAVPEYVRGRIILKGKDDYNTFISFWKNDLKYGVLPFTWKHPITEQEVNVRFRSMWRIVAKTPTYFILEMDLEILP